MIQSEAEGGCGIEVLSLITPSRFEMATAALERLGWELRACDVDLTRETLRIEIRRGELHVMLDARNGRVLLEREIVLEVPAGLRQGRYCQPWARQLLGRSRAEGVRHGLRMMAEYIHDNGAPQLEARAAVALLLG